MAKWADYGITSVRYNDKHTHIVAVRLRKDNGNDMGPEAQYSRQDVVDAIKQGTTFVTIILNSAGNWTKGQPVFIIKVNGTEYIKTRDNGKEEDNLENLPEF